MTPMTLMTSTRRTGQCCVETTPVRELFHPDPKTAAQWRVSRVYWLAVAGLVVWTALVASGRVPGTPKIDIIPFSLILVLGAVNLACRSYERMKRKAGREDRHNAIGWVFVVVDFLLISLGLRFTGGLESPLWVLLFLVGVAETILTAPGEAHLIMAFGALALLCGTLPVPLSLVNGGYFLEIALRTGLFYAVSSVTRRLRENNDADKREVATLRAELSLAEERARLSRDIHDGVGNSLAAAVLRLELAARTLEKQKTGADAPTTVAMLKDEAAALREAMTAVRDWTFFNRPWQPTGSESLRPLSETFAAEVERLSRRTNLPMSVEGAEELDRLNPTTRLTALRVTQEALTNAAKHAGSASGVRVTLRREGNHLILTVEDDGPGFDAEGCGPGVGLASMRERAEGVGGTFVVESAPGRGTRVTARLPAA
jgi:signal transduction histidine kinase